MTNLKIEKINRDDISVLRPCPRDCLPANNIDLILNKKALKDYKKENNFLYMTNKEPAIIIPVFNEEKTIGNVLKKIKNKGSVFVIDDNSTDNSHDIISKYEVNLIKNHSNIGYSKTIQRGIKIVKRNGYKYAITFDSDGEHNIEDIEKITLLLKNNYSLVVGSRNKKNRNIEIFASILTNFFIGIKDPFVV